MRNKINSLWTWLKEWWVLFLLIWAICFGVIWGGLSAYQDVVHGDKCFEENEDAILFVHFCANHKSVRKCKTSAYLLYCEVEDD